MWVERAIVVLVVGAAALWSFHFFTRAWRGKSRCGCGSSGCPAAKETTDRLLRSMEANVSGPGETGGDGEGPEVRHAAQ